MKKQVYSICLYIFILGRLSLFAQENETNSVQVVPPSFAFGLYTSLNLPLSVKYSSRDFLNNDLPFSISSLEIWGLGLVASYRLGSSNRTTPDVVRLQIGYGYGKYSFSGQASAAVTDGNGTLQKTAATYDERYIRSGLDISLLYSHDILSWGSTAKPDRRFHPFSLKVVAGIRGMYTINNSEQCLVQAATGTIAPQALANPTITILNVRTTSALYSPNGEVSSYSLNATAGLELGELFGMGLFPYTYAEYSILPAFQNCTVLSLCIGIRKEIIR